jgi:hypothetical protein
MKEICVSCKNGQCGVFGEKVNGNLCTEGSCNFFKTEEQAKNDRLLAQKRLANLGLEATDFTVDGNTYHGTGTFHKTFCEFVR